MPRPTPFDQFDIKRGQTRGAGKSWWPFRKSKKEDESGSISTERIVGKFKGLIRVESEKERKEYEIWK